MSDAVLGRLYGVKNSALAKPVLLAAAAVRLDALARAHQARDQPCDRCSQTFGIWPQPC